MRHARTANRRGTLWEGRFGSTLVEDGLALWTISLYVDLNPVRACLVAEPSDYRYCGYGEACAGVSVARALRLPAISVPQSRSG